MNSSNKASNAKRPRRLGLGRAMHQWVLNTLPPRFVEHGTRVRSMSEKPVAVKRDPLPDVLVTVLPEPGPPGVLVIDLHPPARAHGR